MIGYAGQTPFIFNTAAFDGSYNIPSNNVTPSPIMGFGKEYNGGIYGDSLYLKDYLLIGKIYHHDTERYGNTGLKAFSILNKDEVSTYWISSRRYYYRSDLGMLFRGRFIDQDGNLSYDNFRRFDLESWSSSPHSQFLRPIITLKK